MSAAKPIWLSLRPRPLSGSVRRLAMAPTMVASSPSRIQTVPARQRSKQLGRCVLGVEAEHLVGAADHRGGDVADRDPAGGGAVAAAPVRVAVDDQVGPGPVDRLGQQVAAEEGVDLAGLAGQGLGHRRVVEQGDSPVGPQAVQGPLQPAGQGLGVTDERLHLGLAEVAGAGPGEAAAEPLGPGDPDPAATDLDDHRVALQDLDAGVLQDLGDRVLLVGVVVVVAEHGHGRHPDAGQLLGQDLGLLGPAPVGQVAGQQEHVGVVGQPGQAGGQPAGRVQADMDVADGRDPDHGRVSTNGSAASSPTEVRLRTSRPGRALATTSPTAAWRSGVATVPVRITSRPSTLTSSSSSAVRGSVARASLAWATRYSSGTSPPVSCSRACSSSDSITQSGTHRPSVWAYSSRLATRRGLGAARWSRYGQSSSPVSTRARASNQCRWRCSRWTIALMTSRSSGPRTFSWRSPKLARRTRDSISSSSTIPPVLSKITSTSTPSFMALYSQVWSVSSVS